MLRGKAKRVFQAELEPIRAARPRVRMVAHREQGDGDALAAAAALGIADVGDRGYDVSSVGGHMTK